MSLTLICDNAYQALVGAALAAAGALPGNPEAIVSIGEAAVKKHAAAVASRLGALHYHVASRPSRTGQLLTCARLRVLLPPALRRILSGAQPTVVFNDMHLVTTWLCKQIARGPIMLIEEGVGAHRNREMRPRAWRRALERLVVGRLEWHGRQGEAPWVDEIWLSGVLQPTAVQSAKPVKTFDMGFVIDEIARHHQVALDLPPAPGPLLIFVGQPLVEDALITRVELEAILGAVGAVLRRSSGRVALAYKPHPREAAPTRAARALLGDAAVMLRQDVSLEQLALEGRPVCLVGFTSGALRNLASRVRCLSVAMCFAPFAAEVGHRDIFPGVTFVNQLQDLGEEIDAFVLRKEAVHRQRDTHE